MVRRGVALNSNPCSKRVILSSSSPEYIENIFHILSNKICSYQLALLHYGNFRSLTELSDERSWPVTWRILRCIEWLFVSLQVSFLGLVTFISTKSTIRTIFPFFFSLPITSNLYLAQVTLIRTKGSNSNQCHQISSN